MCEPYDLHLNDGCHCKTAPVIGFSSYLKRSRDTEPVQWSQQGGKREKFWESPGERGKIAGLLPGRLSFFDLGPGVFE